MDKNKTRNENFESDTAASLELKSKRETLLSFPGEVVETLQGLIPVQ